MSDLTSHILNLITISSNIITNMMGFIEEFFYVMHILIFHYFLVLLNYSVNQVLSLFETDTEKIGIKVFLMISKKYSELKYGAINIYENNPNVKIVVDGTITCVFEIYKKINGVKSEPFHPLWISVFTLTQNLNNNEEYTIVENSVNEIMLKRFKSVIEENMNTTIQNDKLYIFKTPAYILCNIENKFEKDDAKYIVEKSDVKFLSIEYFTDGMNEPINILLNKDIYQIGNEILSNTFVFRYLQYQTRYCVFSNDYIIKVIDDEINEFTLKSNQYVLLDKNEYKIISME